MMNRYFKPIVLALLAGWSMLSAIPLWAQEQLRPSWIRWINRPWEMRYFIYVKSADSWQYLKKRALESNQKPKKDDFDWEQFFEAQTVLRIPHWDLAQKPEKAKYPEDLAVVVIEFDKEGWVTTPNSFGKPLRGRLNSLWPGRIVLSAGDALTDPASHVGEWFIGLNEDTADGVTPALCIGLDDMPPIDPIQVKSYLYGKHYKVKDSWRSNPPFACREWAWQMHDAERPYIDVTSYVPKEPQYGRPHGTYILPFMGWSRFDRQKPVIGKHADTWYCLHECPGGAQPGPIADINTWAKANGWSAPKPPTRMPVFPDDPGRQGKYPQ